MEKVTATKHQQKINIRYWWGKTRQNLEELQ